MYVFGGRFIANSWLRGADSNRRPLGYEPNELPLLHPATVEDCQRMLANSHFLISEFLSR